MTLPWEYRAALAVILLVCAVLSYAAWNGTYGQPAQPQLIDVEEPK